MSGVKFYNVENYVKMPKPELKKQLRQYADYYNGDDEVVKPDWQIEADYKAELKREKSLREFLLEREKRKHELELERVKSVSLVNNNNKWLKANWPKLVHAQLVGKAIKAISLLSNDEANDYDTAKNSLLKAYERVPQYYNEKFRTFVKLVNDSYTEFYQNLFIWYERWLKSLNIVNFGDLHELFLLEQYLNCVPIDVKTYLLEKNVKNAREAAKISDEYTVIHKMKSKTHNNFNNSSKQLLKLKINYCLLDFISLLFGKDIT